MSHAAWRFAARGAAAPAVVALLALFPLAPVQGDTEHKPNDYADPQRWLCHPDRDDDACAAADLETTVLHADGRRETERFSAHPQPPIDCFYVYPTVSTDPTPNSDMAPGPEEYAVIAAQFARLGAQCRRFAPIYRQVTRTALESVMGGEALAVDRELPYDDVADAWRHYLEHHNDERGVVLIGHSQGAGVLTRLLAEKIEGSPAHERLVSALLLGSNLAVPEGETVGGDVAGPGGEPNPAWGLHLVDVHLAKGNLIEILRLQAQAW